MATINPAPVPVVNSEDISNESKTSEQIEKEFLKPVAVPMVRIKDSLIKPSTHLSLKIVLITIEIILHALYYIVHISLGEISAMFDSKNVGMTCVLYVFYTLFLKI